MSGWLGALGALGQLGGAYLASNANQRAANQQVAATTDATNRGLQLQADVYNQNRADLAPYRAAGTGALQTLAGQVGQGWGPGSAGYDFQFGEGMRALDNSASARGMLMSGAQMQAAQRFGQGLAATARGDEMNRLAALAGVGQTATQAGAGLGANYAGQVAGMTANLGQQVGQATAAGTTGSAQPWMQAANNIYSMAMQPGFGKGW
jgi:hypothetical protein